ncbi:diguanylate cyclase [candidate division KSB1 bacterium]|nr:diguanylate cyclase [candidate division KSB1 bacterium]
MAGKTAVRLLNKKTILALESERENKRAEKPERKYFLIFNGKLIGLDKRKKYLIGRALDCDVQIIDSKVSRNHACIRWCPQTQSFIFEDLNSRNGSIINGFPATIGYLQNMDIIDLVGNKITFEERLHHTADKTKVPVHKNHAEMMLEQKFSKILRSVDDRNLKDSLREYHELIVASQNELSMLAYHDQTTGLFNRSYFNMSVDREIKLAQRNKQKVSLIMIDIDHFKKFNDTYGHQKGDEVLEGVAGFIRSAIRTTDIACRYGGEEMTVVLPNTEITKAVKVAEKIRKKVASLSKEQFGIKVTISLGVAEVTKMTKSTVQLIKAADRALYQAKKNGRNNTCAA